MDIFIIVVLVLFSAIFSATETAFSSANRIRLKNLAATGDKRAEKAAKIVDDFDKALTAILIGNNVVNIASASLATIVFVKFLGKGSVGIATAVMTLTVLIFGEVIPKSLAKENADSFALFMAPFLSVIIFVFKPIILPFIWLKNFVAKLVRNDEKQSQPTITEDELKYIIDEIEDEGVLEESESDLVRSALDFDEKTIGEILVPRVNVYGVEISDDVEQIKNTFLDSSYSRLPVYEKSLDNIIGVIHQSDFYGMYLNGGADISSIMKQPVHLITHTKASEALRVMQKEKMHMAVVHDQYGGTEGIVTLEDIIEELVGEIYDESDEIDTSFIKISNNVYDVSAEFSISDMLERLELPEDTIDTDMASLGGFIMEHEGEIPKNGTEIEYKNLRMKVLKSDEHKIERVRVEIEREDLKTEDAKEN